MSEMTHAAGGRFIKREVGRSENPEGVGEMSNVVGIVCPLIEIGLI